MPSGCMCGISHGDNESCSGDPECRFKLDMCQWIMDICSLSSLHGFNWYTRTENVMLKSVILFVCIVILFAMPVVIVQQLVEFMSSNKQQVNVEFKRHDSLSYPNITMCHPKYFDSRLMEGTSLCFNRGISKL
jgi:hypothetical protein